MKKLFCPKCGAELVTDAKFCMHCGEKIIFEKQEKPTLNVADSEHTSVPPSNTDTTTDTNVPVKKVPKKKLIIGSAITLVLLLFLCLYQPLDIVRITSVYNGSTVAGTVIDEKNEGFVVTGYTEDGEKHELSGWKLSEKFTLEPDSSHYIVVEYKDLTYGLYIDCSTSEITGIYAKYTGDPKAGTILDTNNEKIQVFAKHKNGSESELISSWEITEPKTLVADGKETIEIVYEEFKTELEIICSSRTILEITAEYDGETVEGTLLSSANEDITVYAEYKNGDKEKVDGWIIKQSKTLVAGKATEVEIHYKGQTCTLEVECTTMTEEEFKNSCKKISYKNLARDPDDYYLEQVKFKGEIIQVLEDDGLVALRVNVTNDGYGYYDDTVYVLYAYEPGQSKFLEDDIITFYGWSMGLYTYESVLGASITIPEVYAEYIDLH